MLTLVTSSGYAGLFPSCCVHYNQSQTAFFFQTANTADLALEPPRTSFHSVKYQFVLGVGILLFVC